jgi:hypothetical protein
VSKATPHTDPQSSATPHMTAVRHHLAKLRAAHERMHAGISDHVSAAARAVAERRQQTEEETPE